VPHALGHAEGTRQLCADAAHRVRRASSRASPVDACAVSDRAVFLCVRPTARRNVRQYQDYLSRNGAIAAELRPRCAACSASSWRLPTACSIGSTCGAASLRFEQVQLHDPSGVRDRLLQSKRRSRTKSWSARIWAILDVCRALAELGEQVPLNVLVHTRHVAHFNRLQGEAGDRGCACCRSAKWMRH
jgi:hypothetical protein